MAVGTLSSRQSLQNLQTSELPAVIRSGESLGTSQEALQDPNAKTYYHGVHGAKFIMPDGLELVFLGGQLTTNAPAVIKELDAVANKATSLIFTKRESMEVVTTMRKQVAADAADTAGKTAE